MKLYFKCPQKDMTFSSDNYSLNKGYSIVENGEGDKELHGTVVLNSGCPFCGQKHQYEVSDVICPLSGGEDDR